MLKKCQISGFYGRSFPMSVMSSKLPLSHTASTTNSLSNSKDNILSLRSDVRLSGL